jgi:uncharacterized protein (TIGR03118 family)
MPAAIRSHPTMRRSGVVALVLALALLGASVARADGGHANVYKKRNLVSDIDGVARITDPNLVNPWGLAFGPTTPAWVADNGTDVSTLYSGGVNGSIPMILPLVVSIPGGAPTGVVFNGGSGFLVNPNQANSAARFIFDSEAGQITAWSPNVAPNTTAVSEHTTPDAIYKGLAILGNHLYAANFHAGTIDVFDQSFAPVSSPGGFKDPNLPAGYAPFNVQDFGHVLLVAYAQQDADAEDEVAGPGKGYVDVFDGAGHLLRRLISQGPLNAPWGLALAPKGFGAFSGALIVGNFGDGAINAFDPRTGASLGPLKNRDGNQIKINGLWALRFGNGVIGTPQTLLFTAGIGDESHGLFGSIVARGRGND